MTDQQKQYFDEIFEEKDPLVFITEGLVEFRDVIKYILTGKPEHSAILIGLDQSFDKMINRMNFLTGSAATVSRAEEFPPVTNFMGDEITLPKKIVAEDLQPDDLERERYLEKVNTLFQSIDTIPVDGILNTYTLPEDQLVVRGAAKKAGVEGYDERPIDVAFINDIVSAINAKKASSLEDQRIEKELEAQKRLAELTPKLEDARKAGEQLSAQLTTAEESLSKATSDNGTNKAQQRIDLIKVQIEANLELQLNLEDEVAKLKRSTDADTGK